MRPSRHPIRADLVAAARAGEEAAQRHLLAKVQAFVNFVLMGLGGRSAALGDLASDICARVFVKLPRYRGKGSFTSWVGRIASRRFYRWQRAEGKRQRFKAELRVLGGPRTECPEDLVNRREVLAGAAEGVRRLPPRLLDCFVAVHFAGDTPAEAAKTIGGTPRAIANAVYRARKMLHRELEERGLLDPASPRISTPAKPVLGLTPAPCTGDARDPGGGENDDG
ncbi:MAG: sigma-70 family RNA polymerase sigma factor [Deltaproteobacteria bacterium]|nr:sigma-70 family RNA polymerase sigma factor [Deltaproteobacteria bacterium]